MLLLQAFDRPFRNHPQLRERFLTCDRNAPGVVEVVKKCLDMNPGARPGFGQICGDLDPVLGEVWNKQARKLPFPSSIPSHSEEMTPEEADLLVSRYEVVNSLRLPAENGLNHTDFAIPSEELQVRCGLAWGADAAVHEVEWTGTLCALKAFSSDTRIWKEPWFKMLPTLGHENTVGFWGYTLTRLEHEPNACVASSLLMTPHPKY